MEELEKIVSLRKEKCKSNIEHDTCIVGTKDLENLIARYKELEEENKKYPIKMNDEQYNATIDNAQKELKKELERQINAREINEKFIETNYISKSRVKEKIEEYKRKMEKDVNYLSKDYFNYRHKIYALQELLED